MTKNEFMQLQEEMGIYATIRNYKDKSEEEMRIQLEMLKKVFELELEREKRGCLND